jgi:hypothetical protein
MNFRMLTMCGFASLAVPTVVSAQGNPSDAARNWGAIAECAAINEAAARHECMDGVVSRAGVLSEEQIAEAARQEFGREDRRQAVRSTPAPVVSSSPAAPARAADIQELVTTVASVRTVGYRKLRVTTAEGSVWDQTQAESFSNDPRPGDAFSIQRGPLSGYRCQFRQASRYPCERVE